MLAVSTCSTGAFFPTTTVKVAAVLTKSDTFAKKMVMSPIFLGLARKALTRRDKLPIGAMGAKKWATCESLA